MKGRCRKSWLNSFYLWGLLLSLLSFSLPFFSTVAAPVFGPQVSISVNPRSATKDDSFNLVVRVEGAQTNLGTPLFEKSTNFTIQGSGTSTEHQIINGGSSSSTSFNFTVFPNPLLEPGRYRLPRGEIIIGDENFSLDPGEIEITKVAARREAISGVDFVQLVENPEPYIGEQIVYRAEIASNVNMTNATLDNVDFTGFWHENFGSSREKRRRAGNTAIYSIREALFPLETGTFQIPRRILTAEVEVQRRRTSHRVDPWGNAWPDFFDFVPFPSTTTKKIASNALQINVKPLPPTPQGFEASHIPVGALSLSSKLSKTLVKQGESLTLIIELSGTANLRPFELPPFPPGLEKSFKVYPDKPELVIDADGEMLRLIKRFSFALIPLQSGTLSIPALSIPFFNPLAGRYEKLEFAAQSISVLPASADEKLELTGADKSGPGSLEGAKTPLPLALDLAPQFEGDFVLAQEFSLSTIFLLKILLTVPLLAFLLRLYGSWQQKLWADPALRAEREAYWKALKGLNAAKKLPEDEMQRAVYQILRRFVGEKFGRSGSSLTAEESGELLAKRGLDSSLVAELKGILAELEALRFGRALPEASTGKKTAMRERVHTLIQQIEKSL